MGEPVLPGSGPAEPLFQRARGGVGFLDIPQGEGQRQGGGAVRQRRERVLPDERRKQLNRVYGAGAFFRQEQGRRVPSGRTCRELYNS